MKKEDSKKIQNQQMKKLKFQEKQLKKEKIKFNFKDKQKEFLENFNSFFYKNAKTKIVTSEETLTYKKLYKNGILFLGKKKYSKTLKFTDTNYNILDDEKKESVFYKFSKILDYFDSTINLQFSYYNQKNRDSELIESLKIENKNNDFNIYIEEYNEILKEKLSLNDNFRKEKYLTITLQAENLKDSISKFSLIEKELIKNFSKMGSEIKFLNGVERAKLIFELLNYNKEFDFENYRKIEDSKKYIAPDSFNFSDKNFFKIDKITGTSFLLEIIGTELSDEILQDFLELNEELYINFHITPIDQEKGIKLVKRTLTDLNKMKIEEQKKAIRAGYDMDIISENLKEAIASVTELLNDVRGKNENLFYVTIIFTSINEKFNNLKNVIGRLKKLSKKHTCSLKQLELIQEQALISSLPFGLNQLENRRLLTTSATSIFMPFKSKEIIYPSGIYYGVNPLTNNVLIADRLKLKTPNGLILGSSGSGKSFAAKKEISLSFFLSNDEILILDPEDEYTKLVKALGGEAIEISASSKNFINPLDINLNYGGDDLDAISFKTDFMLSFFELIIKRPLDSIENTIVDRALKTIYQPYLKNPITENIPILEDLYNVLLSYRDSKSRALAESLEFYVKGSLNIFNHHTNVDITNRICSYNIKQLGNKLKKLGMQIIQDQVWNRVTINRNRNILTRYYADEFHLFLQDSLTASFFTETYKRFRKWGGVPTGITQNIKNVLAYEGVEDIFENSEFILMLKQAPKDRAILCDLLQLSEKQEEYITDSEIGTGLMKFGKYTVPFKDRFPKNTKLYELLQSSFRK